MIKLTEEKVLRDPIHGYVRVDNEIVWNCIATKEFQRTRRIKQLGSTSYVYHCGEHTRFAHSLGVYEIVRRMVNEVKDIANSLTEYEKTVAMLAGLLHDIGHAPFSHSFENIMKCKHEEYTIQIIREPSEINTVLNYYGSHLADDVARVIEGTYPNKLIGQLVSSQLDADRMDYLLRDSYYTGTKYGEFDLERILRTLRVVNGQLVVKASGVHTIEDYIMARYHMYWQVYYHPVCRSFDAILIGLFKRLVDLYNEDHSIVEKLPMYKDLLENNRMTNEQYYCLDDSTCYYSFHLMEKMGDEVLADLARRVLDRKLFATASVDVMDYIIMKLNSEGRPLDYYLYRDSQSQKPYLPYSINNSYSICVLNKDGSIAELSHVSTLVNAICSNSDSKDELLFYPEGEK